MLAHEKATVLNTKLSPLDSKLVYPPQNLVDLVWRDKPPKPKEPVYEQGTEFTGTLFASLFSIEELTGGLDKQEKMHITSLRRLESG